MWMNVTYKSKKNNTLKWEIRLIHTIAWRKEISINKYYAFKNLRKRSVNDIIHSKCWRKEMSMKTCMMNNVHNIPNIILMYRQLVSQDLSFLFHISLILNDQKGCKTLCKQMSSKISPNKKKTTGKINYVCQSQRRNLEKLLFVALSKCLRQEHLLVSI